MKHISLHVFGKVQGVFFRASTKEQAELLNIKGFARNEPDGSVYIEAEGEEETLSKFEMWCRQGPRMAHVTNVAVKEGTVKNFSRFEIQR